MENPIKMDDLGVPIFSETSHFHSFAHSVFLLLPALTWAAATIELNSWGVEFEGFFFFRRMVWVFKFRKHYNYTIYVYNIYVYIYIFIYRWYNDTMIFMLSVVLVRGCTVYLLYVLSLVSLSVQNAQRCLEDAQNITRQCKAPRLNYGTSEVIKVTLYCCVWVL